MTVTSGELIIPAPKRTVEGPTRDRQIPIFRKAAVEHQMLGERTAEIVFLEVELKP